MGGLYLYWRALPRARPTSIFRPGAAWLQATCRHIVLIPPCAHNHGNTGLDQQPIASIAGVLPVRSAPDSSRVQWALGNS